MKINESTFARSKSNIIGGEQIRKKEMNVLPLVVVIPTKKEKSDIIRTSVVPRIMPTHKISCSVNLNHDRVRKNG